MAPEDTRPPRHGILLFTLGLLTTITAIVSSLGAPLIPAIADDFDIAITQAQWALTATLLTAAVATPIVGRLGAGPLRRPTILAGLVIVTIGSILSAVEVGFVVMVLGRTMQGVGLALVPLALAVAREALPASRLPSAVSMLSVAVVAGAGLGYPLTATVAQYLGVSMAYWLGAVLSAFTLLMALRFIPVSTATTRMRVDWWGALLLSLGMAGVLLAVSQGDHWGWASALTIGLAAVGVLLVGVFVIWTLRSSHPLVDLRLSVRPGVAAPNLIAFGAGLAMYTLLTLTIVMVQNTEWGLGRSIIMAGLTLLPYSIMSVTGSRFALAAARRLGPRIILPIGCAVFICSTVGLALSHSSIVWVFIWTGVGGLGSGFTFSSLAVLIVPHIPQEETGSAMAFNTVLRYLGFCVGSAASVALVTVYGGGEHGFVLTLLTMSSVFALAGVGAWILTPREVR
ncbi:MFS transporter [Williamsia sp. 1138]|uniref:MFS transporter n=1 Tax=Williamsia sp. 1138 TaxID=1903117 RepID=UPI000A0FFFA6|nr:MFS transporter [Williamsia sp. 1138]OZG27567.1 MFS transporter [Williamsia sp. 1138]